MKKLILLSLIVFFFISTQSYAATWLCPPKHEIHKGMDKGDVVMLCGAPMWQDKNIYYTGEGETRQTRIEEVFVYQFPNRVNEKISIYFVNGIVVEAKWN